MTTILDKVWLDSHDRHNIRCPLYSIPTGVKKWQHSFVDQNGRRTFSEEYEVDWIRCNCTTEEKLTSTCPGCSGNMGYYDRPNGERYFSDPEDGTPWGRCATCDGRGYVTETDLAFS